MFLASAASIVMFIEVSSWLLMTPVSSVQPVQDSITPLESQSPVSSDNSNFANNRNEFPKKDSAQFASKRR